MSEQSPEDFVVDGASQDPVDVVGVPDDGSDDIAVDVEFVEGADVDGSAPSAQLPSVEDRTGHPEVDEVLSSLDELDPDPNAQVPVFERAHEALRQALQDAQRDVPSS